MPEPPEAHLGAPDAARPPSLARRLVGLVLYAGGLGVVGWVVVSRREDLARLGDVGAGPAAAVVGLVVVTFLLRAWELRFLVGRLGAAVTGGEAFALTAGATLLNHLPLGAGTAARAAALKRARGLSYTAYAAAMGAQAAVSVSAAGALGLVAVGLGGGAAGRGALAVLAAAALAAPCLLLALPLRRLERAPGWLGARLAEVRRALGRLGGVGWAVLAVTAGAKLALLGVRLWLCFRLLGFPAAPPEALLYAVGTLLVSIAPVVPGGAGVREVLVGGLAEAASASFSEGVLAASLDRAAILLVSAVTGGLGLHHLRRRGAL